MQITWGQCPDPRDEPDWDGVLVDGWRDGIRVYFDTNSKRFYRWDLAAPEGSDWHNSAPVTFEEG